MEEGLLGDSGKAAAFQVGELRPREGTGLTQGKASYLRKKEPKQEPHPVLLQALLVWC